MGYIWDVIRLFFLDPPFRLTALWGVHTVPLVHKAGRRKSISVAR